MGKTVKLQCEMTEEYFEQIKGKLNEIFKIDKWEKVRPEDLDIKIECTPGVDKNGTGYQGLIENKPKINRKFWIEELSIEDFFKKEINFVAERLNDLLDSAEREGYNIKIHSLKIEEMGRHPFYRVDAEFLPHINLNDYKGKMVNEK